MQPYPVPVRQAGAIEVGTGDGAEFRQPLGISIVGGLLVSQLLTLYTTPIVYLYLDRFRVWGSKHWSRLYAGLTGSRPREVRP